MLWRIPIRKPRIPGSHNKAVLLTWFHAAFPSRSPSGYKSSSPFTVTVSFRILTGFSFAHPTGCNLIIITFAHIFFYLVILLLPQTHKFVKIDVRRFTVFCDLRSQKTPREILPVNSNRFSPCICQLLSEYFLQSSCTSCIKNSPFLSSP